MRYSVSVPSRDLDHIEGFTQRGVDVWVTTALHKRTAVFGFSLRSDSALPSSSCCTELRKPLVTVRATYLAVDDMRLLVVISIPAPQPLNMLNVGGVGN
jgi:hypothetical protein